jgi:tetratricopeptide (TPR) repeat protein
LLGIGELEAAREKFNRILELNPGFAPALFYLGEIAFDNKDFEQAAQLYREALQKDTSLPGPRYRLAQFSLNRDETMEARAYLVSELRLAGEDANILVSMGSMFLTAGDLDYATHCLLRAVDVDCSNADAHYYLGVVSAAKGAFEDAAEFFSHALDIKSEHLLSLRDSAAVYLAMGRLEEAAGRIKKACSLADDRRLKSLKRKILLARIREQMRYFLGRLNPRPILRRSAR